MSPHRHNGSFILRRFILLIVLAFGLIWAKLETNVENLWIEGERGYLPLSCIITCKLTGFWCNARSMGIERSMGVEQGKSVTNVAHFFFFPLISYASHCLLCFR